MSLSRVLSVFVLVGSGLFGVVGAGQDLVRYRDYALGSSVDAVVATTGARATEITTLHERPAKLQELRWRVPYVGPGGRANDPVRELVFSFIDGQLYRILVTYDRGRTEGLTDADIIGALSASYGDPVPGRAGVRPPAPVDALPGAVVIARWERPSASMTLARGHYGPEFQLIVVSTALSARATTAVREALKLDVLDAPRRESEQRVRDAAEATAEREKARTINKGAFRP